ncbi:uncharacterized protein LOC143364134 [Halictus rubicundus]|uniref:uncharacterized protein LOC143364134 n=1 Tax=Halictus rubicundus TaxID=77578 RepID=UPI004036BA82
MEIYNNQHHRSDSLPIGMPPKKKLSGAQFKQIREAKKAAAVKNSGNIEQFFPRELPSTSKNTNNKLNIELNLPENIVQNVESNSSNGIPTENNSANQQRLEHDCVVENSIDVDFCWNYADKWRCERVISVNKDTIKLYIEHGPINGDDIVMYPLTNNRRFERKWFTRTMTNGEQVHRNWLIYCKQLDSLFCFPCTLFNDDRSSIWLSGFNDWQHLNPYLSRHESSISHRANYIKMKKFEKKLKCGGFVDDHLLEQLEKEKGKWRHVLKRDELISHYDSNIKKHIDSHNKGAISYFSPKIRNELIDLAAKQVQSHIIQNIKKEQMVQIIRYVHIDSNKKCKIEESFITFINTEAKTGEGLSREILDKLAEDGLEIANVRGQSYDNGANMAGKYKGVQAQIIALNENARFIPCTAHSLNLIAARWKLLQTELKTTLKGSCDTRWSSKANAVHAMNCQLPTIVNMLKKMTESDQNTGDKIVQAKSILKSIQTFEFTGRLKFWDSLLSKINRINLALQDKNFDIARATGMIKGLLSQLTIYRETFFPTILQSSAVTAEELEVTPDFQDTRKRKKKMVAGEKAKDDSQHISAQTQFKVELTQVIDSMITKINTRFVALNEVADDFAFLSGQAILATDVTQLTKMAADLALKYPNDLDPYEFSLEIESFKLKATTLMNDLKDKSMNHFQVLEKIYELSLENVYPNIITALRIFLCMPVTTATCERSFSKLKLIKSYLRSSLAQEHLANMSIFGRETGEAGAAMFGRNKKKG